jgi:hypothetical protein
MACGSLARPFGTLQGPLLIDLWIPVLKSTNNMNSMKLTVQVHEYDMMIQQEGDTFQA